ncbi:hypothetical protein LCGC14_0613810 [marine sediment metagenome]|uniref:Uncharacterized protein n=1 Tax=marine sediment metagenome TaxID=412755 RepID=A0A0F9TT63_9ZZZZ
MLNDIIDGLLIFKKYVDDGDKAWLCTGGLDVLYGPDLDKEVTNKDKEELEKLGWRFGDDEDGWYTYV